MSFKIGNVEIKNNVVLAPMAGFSNTTFRKICKKMGVGLVVAEMVSDKAIVYENEKTLDLLKMTDEERPISQQIFGSDPESMRLSAQKIVEIMHPDIIDINIGCPVPKVAIKNHAGSALMKNPELVREIVSGVVAAVDVPVTVKIRSGWDSSSINAPLISQICEEAGASAITVHGRTRAQNYSGKVDLDVIKDVVKSVSIPVIGNGDIKTVSDAKKMLEYTGCAAVMIGRGALGNPWLIKDIVDYFDRGIINDEVSIKERIDMMKYHLNELCQDKNEKVAILEMRSNLMYYFRYLPNSKNTKKLLCNAKTKKEIITILDDYLTNIA